MSVNLLLHSPQYRPNLSSMIRSAEFYGLTKVYIIDANNLLRPPSESKKARAEMEKMARVWTAGAIEFVEIIKIEDLKLFLAEYEGRKIATLVDESARNLNEFQFQEGDLLIMGSEKEGLPEEVLPLLDQAVYIPALGHTPCLNVAVTCGIVLHQALKSIAEK
jgi:tRNA G18 (ribose-2'-O)-methylase SpoU